MNSVGKKLLTVSNNSWGQIILSPSNTYTNYCQYSPPATSCSANVSINFSFENLRSPAFAVSQEYVSGDTFTAVMGGSNYVVFSASTGSTRVGTYRIAVTLQNGIIIYSEPFTMTVEAEEVILVPEVILNNESYNNSCVYFSGTSCYSAVSVDFSIINGSATSAFVTKISGDTIPVVDSGLYSSNTAGYFVMGQSRTAGSLSAVYRVVAVVNGVNYYSPNFSINLVYSANVTPPSISYSGDSTGSCNYLSPATSCSASTTKNYNVFNYVNGTLSVQRLSGSTAITATRTGTNTSGYYTFTSNVSSTISATYRFVLSASAGTIYSDSFSVVLSGSNIYKNDLKVWLDFNSGSSYVNAVDSSLFISGVNGQQSTSSPVSASLGSHHYRAETSGAGSVLQFNTTNYPGIISNNQTIAFWFKYSNTRVSSASEIYRLALFSGRALAISINKEDAIPRPLYINYGSASYQVDGVAIENNQWYFLALCLSSFGLTVYLNGVEVDYISRAVSQACKPNRLAETFTTSYSHTRIKAIDSFAMWDRVLNSSEIAYLYNGGVGRTYSML